MDRFFYLDRNAVCGGKQCSSGFYLNELACECFSYDVQCFMSCESVGKFDMPIEHCGCTKNYDDYLALFPDGTTDAEISNSIKEGTENQTKKDQENKALDIPEEWPKCKDFWECEFGTFNYLACTCFSDIFCALWCGEDMQLDPT